MAEHIFMRILIAQNEKLKKINKKLKIELLKYKKPNTEICGHKVKRVISDNLITLK